MRYALISDIHGNLPALEAVLADIGARDDIDGVYHLGDLVGYGSSPNEVVARLRTNAIAGISGNYDSTVAMDYKHCGCRADTPRDEELAHISFEWTRRNISPDTKRFLGSLPFRLDLRPLGGHVAGPTIALVHATPDSNLVYVTEDRPDDFLRKMASRAGLKAGDTICFGHTHKPWHREVDGIQFVNTGSVGRPKDGDWRACWILFDSTTPSVGVDTIRVPYDVDAAVAGIAKAGLPSEFGEFLRAGGSPSPGRSYGVQSPSVAGKP
jgi:predicted phosphodiesterase